MESRRPEPDTLKRKISGTLAEFDRGESESRFVQAIADQVGNNADIVCSTYLYQSIFTVAAMDNLYRNLTSRLAGTSLRRTRISIF